MMFTSHVAKKLAELGFDVDGVEVRAALAAHPYPSLNHAGQWRYAARGVCLVVQDDVVITAYKDHVITPLRPDQIAQGVQIKRNQ